MKPNVKLVVFDLNRTLINENTWEDLNLAMGVTAEEDELFMKWYEEGIVTYEEGQKFLDRIYIARGKANREKMLDVVNKYTYRTGANEIIEYLGNKGYKLALVSGSIDLVVERVAGELGIGMWRAHNKLKFDAEGNFVMIDCSGDDADFKHDALMEFCRDLGIEAGDALCVGDGFNDRRMFTATGRGVTFKGSRIEKYSWKTISGLKDLEKLV